MLKSCLFLPLQLKKKGIGLYRANDFSPKVITVDGKTMRNIFTAEEFRRRYEKNKAIRRIFNQIDPHFLELSNEDKMKVLDSYIEEHDRGGKIN